MPSPTDHQTPVHADPDLAEQARPGYGVPSQDPEPSAQIPIDAAHAEVEGRSVFVGAGVLAGAATGAAVGTAIAGPVGVVVGGTIGAVAGALGGAAAGAMRPAENT
ncbi:MAG: bacteriocin [Pseudomonadota bacterium]